VGSGFVRGQYRLWQPRPAPGAALAAKAISLIGPKGVVRLARNVAFLRCRYARTLTAKEKTQWLSNRDWRTSPIKLA